MLTLNDGRSELWQWDTGRTLAVDADCSQVHFSNKVFGRSIDVDVFDGVATIPDFLLQTDKDLIVWAFSGTAENGYTKISKTFKVNRRNKPADYVFTPPEQTTLEQIKQKIDYLESIQDPDAIKNAVDDYLEQNPVESPVQSVNGKTGAVKLNAIDVGAISQDNLQDATNKALAQAKASGEFDGDPGANGHTPEYGVDYGTPEQVAEIAQSAAEILQPEVNQLKDDLANKIDKPSTAPAVGKILKVTAVNDDGTFVCEWADAPSGGGAVDDVQIAGKSIVQESVANIPYAVEKTGVVKMHMDGLAYDTGVQINTAGWVILTPASNGRISNRTIVNCPITPKNVDYSVKAAMCDGKGATWTDAERIAALLRMGCTVDDNGVVKWTAQEVAE